MIGDTLLLLQNDGRSEFADIYDLTKWIFLFIWWELLYLLFSNFQMCTQCPWLWSRVVHCVLRCSYLTSGLACIWPLSPILLQLCPASGTPNLFCVPLSSVFLILHINENIQCLSLPPWIITLPRCPWVLFMLLLMAIVSSFYEWTTFQHIFFLLSSPDE